MVPIKKKAVVKRKKDVVKKVYLCQSMGSTYLLYDNLKDSKRGVYDDDHTDGFIDEVCSDIEDYIKCPEQGQVFEIAIKHVAEVKKCKCKSCGNPIYE